MKRYGFSDRRLGELTGRGEREVRALRIEHGVLPVYKAVDTCAAEFEPRPRTSTRPTRRRTRRCRGAGARRHPRSGPTASARASSSTTAACTPPSPPGARLRGGHGQLQPGDGQHRLRHLDRLYFEPLTFEDVAGIVATSGRGASSCSSAARRRSRSPARSPRPASRSWARPGVHRPRRGPRALRRPARGARRPLPEYGSRPRPRRPRRWRRASATRCWCARRTCSGPRHADRLRPQGARALHAHGRQREPEHPVLIDKFLEDAIEVDVERHLRRRRRLHRRRHAARGGGRRALGRLRLRHPVHLPREGTLEQVRNRPGRWRSVSACAGSSTCSSPTRATSCTCSR